MHNILYVTRTRTSYVI